MSIGNFNKSSVIGIVAAAALFGVAAPAHAESTKDRVRRLESQVSELQAASQAAITASANVSRLEEEVRTLTGTVEELTYRLQQADMKINSMSRVLAGESPEFSNMAGDGAFGASDAIPGATSGPVDLTGRAPDTSDFVGGPVPDQFGPDLNPDLIPGPTAGTAIELPFDPEAAFQYADGFLLSNDYSSAEEAFKLYLSSFPSHPRAADAQFRLGEIYLATSKNEDAADAFIAHIQNYPNDPRAAEAYVKLASAFGKIGETKEACKVLGVMKNKFPNASFEVLNRANREVSRNNCE